MKSLIPEDLGQRRSTASIGVQREEGVLKGPEEGVLGGVRLEYITEMCRVCVEMWPSTFQRTCWVWSPAELFPCYISQINFSFSSANSSLGFHEIQPYG